MLQFWKCIPVLRRCFYWNFCKIHGKRLMLPDIGMISNNRTNQGSGSDNYWKIFHNKLKGFLTEMAQYIRREHIDTISLLPCYIPNREVVNYSCFLLKFFTRFYAKKIMWKRHLSITNKKRTIFGRCVDLKLKVKNILFTIHITLVIWMLWKNVRNWTRWWYLSGSKVGNQHCMKSVYIRSFSGPHFSSFGLNTKRYLRYFVSLRISVRIRENADQTNSEHRNIWRSASNE